MGRIARCWIVFALLFVVLPFTLDPLLPAIVEVAVPWPYNWLVLIVVNFVLAWFLARWAAGSGSRAEYNTRP